MTLSRSYREAMEHIEVTPAMRERILHNLETAASKPAKVVHFVPWKQIFSVAACAAVLVIGVTALPHGGELGSASSSPDSIVGTAAPTQDFSSAAELSAAAGFSVPEPQKLPFEVQTTTYTLIWGEIAQVKQAGTEEQCVAFRVSQDSEDNSGDYTVYETEQHLNCNGVDITLKGNDDGFYLAVWQTGDFSYSVHSSVGMTVEQMEAVIQSVQ